jgi:hypothetical protein
MRLRPGIRDLCGGVLAAYLFFGCIVPFTHTCRPGACDSPAAVASSRLPGPLVHGCRDHSCADATPQIAGDGMRPGDGMPVLGVRHCRACLLAKTVNAIPDAAKSPCAVFHTNIRPAPRDGDNHLPDDPSLKIRLFRGPPA